MTFINTFGLRIWQCFLNHSSGNHKNIVLGYNVKYYFTVAVSDKRPSSSSWSCGTLILLVFI